MELRGEDDKDKFSGDLWHVGHCARCFAWLTHSVLPITFKVGLLPCILFEEIEVKRGDSAYLRSLNK